MTKRDDPADKHQRQSVWAWIYHHLAALYDSVDWFTFNTTHRYRLKLLPYLPQPRTKILEVGVGTGKLHQTLAAKYSCYGIDAAMGMLHTSQKRLHRADSPVNLAQANAIKLPWKDTSFDAIVSTFVFSAIPDLDALIVECDRILKPGGLLLIVDAGRAEDGNLCANILARTWELMGDYIRDERPLLIKLGYQVVYKEYPPKGSLHLIRGLKPE